MARVQRACRCSRRRTSATRCWSGCASWPSSPATSTSSSRCGSPGLKQQVAAGHSWPSPDGLAAPQVLERIRDRVLQLQALHSEHLAGHPRPAGRGGHPDRPLRGAPGATAGAAPAVPRRDLPGADPARGGPVAPLPVHQRPVAVARGHGPRSRGGRGPLRAHQGAARAAAPVGGGHPAPTSWSSRSSPPTSTRCSRAWRSATTTCSG